MNRHRRRTRSRLRPPADIDVLEPRIMLAADLVGSFTKIASGTNGGPALADLDRFGSSVTALGDLDGDGVTDLATGAYGDNTGGSRRGAVHVLFMNSDGTVKNSTKIASGTNGGPALADFSYFGSSVAVAGDLDGDGVNDLAVGAIGDSTGGASRGAVYVLFLNADGTVKNNAKIASGTSGAPTLADFDFFGTFITSLGDLDGDGVSDLAVGADGDDTGGNRRGAVHVLFLNADGTIKSSTKIADNTNGGPTLADGDAFGFSVAVPGDLDGDGVTDLAVGADLDDTGGDRRGAVHALFLNADGTVKGSTKIASGTNGGPPLSDFDRFGSSVAALGDLDGDGIGDLAVGGVGDDTGGTYRGAVHVLFMNADGTAKTTTKIADNTSGGPTLANDEAFGSSVAALGDLNGDGIGDLAVGAAFDDTGGSYRGALYVLFLATVNEAPVITSPAAVNVAENQTAVIDVQSSDPDGETENGGGLSYGLTGGADLGSFSIDVNTGLLTFDAAPDFETPADAGADNVYNVQITVTDAGLLTGVQNLAVTVTDENDTPGVLSFEAESELFHQIGQLDADGWSANTIDDTVGFLNFGPYTTEVPAGTQTAVFRLLVDNNTADNLQVVELDVFDATSGKVLIERAITRQEFTEAFTYQDFALDFTSEAGHQLEFRTLWLGTSYVRQDRVTVTADSEPQPAALVFEAEMDLFHQIGRADVDGWSARTLQDASGFLNFGPYTTDVSAGTHTAGFRLLVDNNTADNLQVVTLDIFDATAGQLLVERSVTRQEFNEAFIYQDFSLDFTSEAGHQLEFRTLWLGTSYVRQDRVTVTTDSEPQPAALVFEAETDLFHQIGRADADGWSADTLQDASGFLNFGPYTTDVPAGTHTAGFRLLVDNNTADNFQVVTLDVFDATSGKLLTERTVTRQEFNEPLTYQEFALDFTNEAGHQLEFRTLWLGTSYVRQDSVHIQSSPNGNSSLFVVRTAIDSRGQLTNTTADVASGWSAISIPMDNGDTAKKNGDTSMNFDMTLVNVGFELKAVADNPGHESGLSDPADDGFDHEIAGVPRVGIRRNLDGLFADPGFLDEIALISS